jgi:excisionase family DNA binding protein
MMSISTAEAAKRRNVTMRYIQRLIKEGRIPGAERLSGVWLVPENFVVLPSFKRPRRSK